MDIKSTSHIIFKRFKDGQTFILIRCQIDVVFLGALYWEVAFLVVGNLSMIKVLRFY